MVIVINIPELKLFKIKTVEKITPFLDSLYQSNEELDNLERATVTAINKIQSDRISKLNANNSRNKTDILASTIDTNRIITDTKNASIKAQFNKMTPSKITKNMPDKDAVKTANIVATNISNDVDNPRYADIKEGDYVILMVPGGPMPFEVDSDFNFENKLTTQGIMGQNNFSDINVRNRASIAVDANLAIISAKNIANEKSIKIDNANNISFLDKIGKYLQNDVDTLNNQQIKSSIVPVSTNLNILSNPVKIDILNESSRLTDSEFKNKSALNIKSTNRIANIVKNGVDERNNYDLTNITIDSVKIETEEPFLKSDRLIYLDGKPAKLSRQVSSNKKLMISI